MFWIEIKNVGSTATAAAVQQELTKANFPQVQSLPNLYASSPTQQTAHVGYATRDDADKVVAYYEAKRKSSQSTMGTTWVAERLIEQVLGIGNVMDNLDEGQIEAAMAANNITSPGVGNIERCNAAGGRREIKLYYYFKNDCQHARDRIDQLARQSRLTGSTVWTLV